MKTRAAIFLTGALVASCASGPAETTKKLSGLDYYEHTFPEQKIKVFVSSRFTQRLETEDKLWIYSDYEGSNDQEFILVYSGRVPPSDWLQGTTKVETDIGVAHEKFSGVELSQLSLDTLSKKHGFESPPCAYGRELLTKDSNSNKFVSITYLEGASCASAFQSWGEMESMRRLHIRNRADAVVKLKPL